MHYTNSEMKLDQLIGYFNGRKINLIPPFQRGHVWRLPQRRALLGNMITGRPIPAIFLYKEEDGAQFSYNILDGKQRLESLILFIGNQRADMRVDRVREYFFDKATREMVNFSITYAGGDATFKSLPEKVVREFREYAIPTIEIDLDDDSSLDEIINLFIDINTYGEKVKRFDMVKAIGRDNPFLKSAFDLVAAKQKRKQDVYYKKKNNPFTRVLQQLQTVERVGPANQKVDRMWERLVEVALFCRNGNHRAPSQILKGFISRSNEPKISAKELNRLHTVFNFLDKAYEESSLGTSRLARDVPHFYTMVTTLLKSALLDAPKGREPDYAGLRRKLLAFAKLIGENAKLSKNRAIATKVEEYEEAATRQTTHPGRRDTREKAFLDVLDML